MEPTHKVFSSKCHKRAFLWFGQDHFGTGRELPPNPAGPRWNHRTDRAGHLWSSLDPRDSWSATHGSGGKKNQRRVEDNGGRNEGTGRPDLHPSVPPKPEDSWGLPSGSTCLRVVRVFRTNLPEGLSETVYPGIRLFFPVGPTGKVQRSGRGKASSEDTLGGGCRVRVWDSRRDSRWGPE